MPMIPDALSHESPEFWNRLMTAILEGVGIERRGAWHRRSGDVGSISDDAPEQGR